MSGDSRVDHRRWRAHWAIIRRELRSLRSEKTIILALAIQLFIAGFSSFLVVGLVTLYDPSAVDGYETEIAITGEDTDALLSVAAQQEGLAPRYYTDRDDAFNAFENGGVAAVLDGNRDANGQLGVRVTAPEEGIETTVLVVQVRDVLESIERTERQERSDRLENEPLVVPDEQQASPYFGFTYTILLPLLLFLPVFISGSIAVDSLVEERQRGTLELLRVAPLSFADVIDAKLFGTAMLAPIQAALWLFLLAVNGVAIANPVALIAFVAMLSVVVVGAGMAVALVSPDRRQSQLLYSGGIVGTLVVASLLPEHPANTIAKLALGSQTPTTWGLLLGYCLVGVGTYVGIRTWVSHLDPDTL